MLASPSRLNVIVFALPWAGALSAVAYFVVLPSEATYALFGFAALLLLIAIAVPRALHLPYRAWMAFGRIIGLITTPILLIALYIAMFVPTRLFLALAGKDPLARRRQADATSYWKTREHAVAPEDFRRLG